jgi:hypothetical protein
LNFYLHAFLHPKDCLLHICQAYRVGHSASRQVSNYFDSADPLLFSFSG